MVDRANYARLRPVMRELRDQDRVELLTVCSGTMLLERFGRVRDLVESDGFRIDAEVYLEVEGAVPITMTKSIGMAIIEFASEFLRLKPDFVLIIGDRYEALGAAVAAVFQNICLIHLQGGEVSGSIDESTRHAITKLAHYHFPATDRAAHYIHAMGERLETVFPFGCPSRDVVDEVSATVPFDDVVNRIGVGAPLDFNKPFLLVLFHPVTTEMQTQETQADELLKAVQRLGMQTLLLWPNIDAGSDRVSQAIRRFREYNHDFPLHAIKNLETRFYLPVLQRAACCVGNSSSFVRETSFLGTPVVLVGSRQDGREWSDSVMRIEPNEEDIFNAIQKQLARGRYPTSDLYGSPGVSTRIAAKVAELKPYAQKRLAYDAGR
jgi:UDP-hydrolysing UDP-N-acetyl-D-glucosamine 2-epimerase